MNIELRDIKLTDIEQYLYLNHPSRKFHNFNWPYFKQRSEKELSNYIKSLEKNLKNWNNHVLENKKLIVDNNDEIIWEANWYWKSEETLWMEIWIVIFNEGFWWKWIWYIALKKWINQLFDTNPKIIRLWLTTWSWNIWMVKLAEKLKFKKEAVYRKARIVNWKYYDSISYWILRDEWDNIS